MSDTDTRPITVTGDNSDTNTLVCVQHCYRLLVIPLLLLLNETFTVLSHTPPEVWVRAKKNFITFDTNFGHYLPRGTKIDGSQKCRLGAFFTSAKNSGEMP